MKNYLAYIGRIRVFLLGACAFILLGLIVLFLNNKTALHISLNQGHNSLFDTFFFYLTYLGDGIFAALAVILISIHHWKKYKWKLLTFGLSCIIGSGLIAQSLKHFVFPDADRPLKFIGKKYLSLIEGVEMHQHYSFPSGHTTSAFTLMAFISFIYFAKKQKMQVVLLVTAVLIGYSRIYLSQHFLEDVVAGAFIGTFSFLLFLSIFRIAGIRFN